MSTATSWVRTNRINPTDLNTTYDSSPDHYTDVIAYDRYYDDYCNVDWATSPSSGGATGLTTCNYLSPTDKCESADVRYNLNWAGPASTTNQRHLACHENGHAIGLSHLNTTSEMIGLGCMNAGDGVTSYTSHDISHINNNFP